MKQTYIPVIGRLLIAVKMLMNGRHKVDSRYDFRPLWKRHLKPSEIRRINMRVAWRRFDTQTRGMGLVFVLLITAMVVIQVLSGIFAIIYNYINEESNKATYGNALKTACSDKQFYAWNFYKCEDVNIRPR